jgi:hypothetical protein
MLAGCVPVGALDTRLDSFYARLQQPVSPGELLFLDDVAGSNDIGNGPHFYSSSGHSNLSSPGVSSLVCVDDFVVYLYPGRLDFYVEATTPEGLESSVVADALYQRLITSLEPYGIFALEPIPEPEPFD